MYCTTAVSVTLPYKSYRYDIVRIQEKLKDSNNVKWLIHTGCNRRNGPDFGRVFLRSNYTDITQNTYIQSWTVTEIMAIEMCGFLGCRRTVVSDVILVHCACPTTRHGNAVTLASAVQWVGELWSSNMPFVFSRVEYCDMHFCVRILWWHCKCCCRRISKTLPRKNSFVHCSRRPA